MISLNIEKIRLQKRWSQNYLAKISGLSPASISMFETGKREPSLKSLLLLSKVFCMSIDDLVNSKDFEYPKDFEFIGTFEQLNTSLPNLYRNLKMTITMKENFDV